MSSPGGVGNSAKVIDQGIVQLGDQELDPRVAADLAAIKSGTTTAEFEAIKSDLTEDWNLVLNGDKFVEKTDYSAVIDGPQEADGGDEASQQLREHVYDQNSWICPQGNSTAQVHGEISGELEFTDSVSLAKKYFENPTAENEAAFTKQVFAYTEGKVNIHEILFLVFKESIQETNEDKKYFLQKMKDFNSMGEDLSDYLREMVDASTSLSEQGEGKKYPEKERVNIDVKEFDLSTLNTQGNLEITTSETKSVDRSSLNDQIKMLESMQETVRNKRQMASTSFQNLDQKVNQLYNLISSVMKNMNEMRAGTVRNML